MGEPLMPWGRLDDGLYDHPKLDALGRQRLAAVGLWTLAISWCNRRLTDGLVPAERIRLLGGTPALAELLVTAGLFDRTETGYAIHDFLAFNESRVDIELRREADRKRKRKPNGLHPEPSHTGAGPAEPRPDPDVPVLDTPRPPSRGGRRADGTNHRSVVARMTAEAEERERERVARRKARGTAYREGRITEAQLDDMNDRDAPLEEIPTKRGAAYGSVA